MHKVKMVIRLAFRNLSRNRKRTILTTTGLSVGLIVLILAFGMMDGFTTDSVRLMMDYEVAHVKGYAQGYLEEDIKDLSMLIDHSNVKIDGIREDNIGRGTERLVVPGIILNGTDEGFVNIIGVDLEKDKNVYNTMNSIVVGEGLKGNGVLIGYKLAKDMNLKVGDAVTLFLRSKPGALNTRTFKISGLLKTNHVHVDMQSAFISLNDARELAITGESATEIALKIDDYLAASSAKSELVRNFSDLEWETWEEATADVVGLMRFKKITSFFVVLVLAAVAAIAVSNTMIMAVQERSMEIGALRALGFEGKTVASIFMMEGMLIGVLSGIIAIIIGGALVMWLGNIGIGGYEDMDYGFPVGAAIYPELRWGTIGVSFFFGVVVAMAASWNATRRVARGEVVRALREGLL